jgi:hypothetical protein
VRKLEQGFLGIILIIFSLIITFITFFIRNGYGENFLTLDVLDLSSINSAQRVNPSFSSAVTSFIGGVLLVISYYYYKNKQPNKSS